MNSIQLTNDEIRQMAIKNNVSYKEMLAIIKTALIEMKNINDGIEKTIDERGYVRFPNELVIYDYGKQNELNNNFICYTPNIKKVLAKDKKDLAIVTGFGATNSPTAGTLSMILNAISLQKKTGIYTHLIVSDLGSFNARNISLNYMLDLRDNFLDFIGKMGFDFNNGELRTHNDFNHATTRALVTRFIKLEDFNENKEVTDDLYDKLNLRGTNFSTLADHIYSASDVLLPILRDGKSGIIVPSGLEEFYHANIGGLALSRMMKDESMKKCLPDDIEIASIYCKLIPGFFPFVKQSKSIPYSSVNLSNTRDELYDKIINSKSCDEEVILKMILQTSNFDEEQRKRVIEIYNNRSEDEMLWKKIKLEYLDYFLSIKDIWDSCEKSDLSLRKRLYKR